MKYWNLFILIITCISCNYDNSKTAKLTDFVPQNTYAIVSVGNFDDLKSSLNNNDLYELISNSNYQKELNKKLDFLEFLKPTSKVLLCFSKDANDSTQYTLITKYDKHILQTDSLTDYIEETLIYKNKNILKHTINSPFYSTMNDSILMISTSLKLVEESNNGKRIHF